MCCVQDWEHLEPTNLPQTFGNPVLSCPVFPFASAMAQHTDDPVALAGKVVEDAKNLPPNEKAVLAIWLRSILDEKQEVRETAFQLMAVSSFSDAVFRVIDYVEKPETVGDLKEMKVCASFLLTRTMGQTEQKQESPQSIVTKTIKCYRLGRRNGRCNLYSSQGGAGSDCEGFVMAFVEGIPHVITSYGCYQPEEEFMDFLKNNNVLFLKDDEEDENQSEDEKASAFSSEDEESDILSCDYKVVNVSFGQDVIAPMALNDRTDGTSWVQVVVQTTNTGASGIFIYHFDEDTCFNDIAVSIIWKVANAEGYDRTELGVKFSKDARHYYKNSRKVKGVLPEGSTVYCFAFLNHYKLNSFKNQTDTKARVKAIGKTFIFYYGRNDKFELLFELLSDFGFEMQDYNLRLGTSYAQKHECLADWLDDGSTLELIPKLAGGGKPKVKSTHFQKAMADSASLVGRSAKEVVLVNAIETRIAELTGACATDAKSAFKVLINRLSLDECNELQRLFDNLGGGTTEAKMKKLAPHLFGKEGVKLVEMIDEMHSVQDSMLNAVMYAYHNATEVDNVPFTLASLKAQINSFRDRKQGAYEARASVPVAPSATDVAMTG